MILTRTHALYFAARRLPAALRKHAQDTSIDSVVNAHAPRPKGWPGQTEPGNTLTLLRSKAKRGEHIDWVLETGTWVFPGEGKPDVIFGYQRIDRRIAYCRKWAKKILKGRKP
jgi:hypothetical protein